MMFSLRKSTHTFNKEFSLGLKFTDLTLNLLLLPSTMGLLSFHLDHEQLKDRTLKSSTMSQALCSTIVLEFL
jgi:hypothetical protein